MSSNVQRKKEGVVGFPTEYKIIPKISEVYTEDEIFHFCLSEVNVSIANAIRRVILSEINTVVIHTETYEENQCQIEIGGLRTRCVKVAGNINATSVCAAANDYGACSYLVKHALSH